MNETVPGDNTEQVDQTLGRIAHMAPNSVPAGGRVEDGKVNVGVRISGVKEATKADRVLRLPELEDAVGVDEVVEEAAVLVPALACADGSEEGDQVGRRIRAISGGRDGRIPAGFGGVESDETQSRGHGGALSEEVVALMTLIRFRLWDLRLESLLDVGVDCNDIYDSVLDFGMGVP
ncbi:hypothetical protein RJ639_018819 [Escallonia herrerae]|uniref:Uncharacterized protein n=1 Tax=Escallonia herrerae TaxID=1293975 RepID=A0AA88V8X0_9ASTE|nr:hypothetical protein RJ639_018819 [Escallonia herrerae]